MELYGLCLEYDMCTVVEFDPKYQEDIWLFLKRCLPESGRKLDLTKHHREYLNINASFEKFWCLLDGEMIIGTVAVRRIGDRESELKALYLLEKYHGRGLGRLLLETALVYVAERGYRTIFLDTMSSSDKAVRLYKKAGFITTDRYNNNENADVFMKLTL